MTQKTILKEETELEKSQKTEYFELRDIIFLAIMSGLITLANFLTVPLVVAIPLVGIRQLASAFPHGLLFTIGVLKVRKRGTIFILATLTGLVLLPISWIIPMFNIISGAICELLVFLIFKNYEKDRSIILGVSLFNPLTVPSAFLISLWAAESISEYLANPIITIIMIALCLVISLIGTLCGLRIGESLRKAGKLK